jgi:hypothetical protein
VAIFFSNSAASCRAAAIQGRLPHDFLHEKVLRFARIKVMICGSLPQPNGNRMVLRDWRFGKAL